MDAVDVLKAARDLISKPGGWTQNAWARDKKLRPVGSWSPNAVCFCAGAALTAIGDNTLPSSLRAKSRHFLFEAIGHVDVPEWNDVPGRTQADVVAAFDLAIALAERAA